MFNEEDVVSQIVEKVGYDVSVGFNKSKDLPLKLAKQVALSLGFLKVNKGPTGGVSPTLDGLSYANINAEAFFMEKEKDRELAKIQKKINALQAKREKMLNRTEEKLVGNNFLE